MNHLRMKELNKEEIRYEIEEDISIIEAYSSQKVFGFAYPFGEYNKKNNASSSRTWNQICTYC